jgi:2-polyprenyl-3-methyl-5-hydroxy-6-metoxy-1,4-benzoquinol methylase
MKEKKSMLFDCVKRIRHKLVPVERSTPEEAPFDVYQKHINKYIFASQFVYDKLVLDVACGCGDGALILTSKKPKIVIGLDKSKDAINYAKKHYARDGIVLCTRRRHVSTFPRQLF